MDPSFTHHCPRCRRVRVTTRLDCACRPCPKYLVVATCHCMLATLDARCPSCEACTPTKARCRPAVKPKRAA